MQFQLDKYIQTNVETNSVLLIIFISIFYALFEQFQYELFLRLIFFLYIQAFRIFLTEFQIEPVQLQFLFV